MSNGERAINAGTNGLNIISNQTVPASLGMSNVALGAPSWNSWTPGITVPVASGIYNKALLVKCWGKVTSSNITNGWFYLNDGSNLSDGSGNIGTKICWAGQAVSNTNPQIVAPLPGWWVSVTGLNVGESSGNGTFVRMVRPRRQEDITILTPQDIYGPHVKLTMPYAPYYRINKDVNATNVWLIGTATDGETGVASVQIGFTDYGSSNDEPTVWENAEYDRNRQTWKYLWQNTQAKKVWVRATDYANNNTLLSQNVSVYNVGVIYVNWASLDDSGDGLTWATAKRTLKAGLDAAIQQNKSNIWVASGTYLGNVTIESNKELYGGFIGKETAREERNWTTNRTIITGSVNTAYNSASNTRIDGFFICGVNVGISLTSNKMLTIQNNTISGCTDTAIDLNGNKTGAKIINNVITGPMKKGIYCNDSSPLIINNNITGANIGIHVEWYAPSPQIYNNIIAYNNYGIYKQTGLPALHCNCVYGNYISNYYNVNPGSGDINQDPKIVTGSHIAPNSPCIDAGYDIVNPTPDWDVDRQPRAIGSHIDIGVDESDGCEWYDLIVPECLGPLVPGTETTITMKVKDWEGHDVPDTNVCFNVSDCELVAINGISQTGNDACGITDNNGNITCVIKRNSDGYAVLVADVIHPCGIRRTTVRRVIWFSLPDDWPMFMHDAQHTGCSKTWDLFHETLVLQWSTPVPTATTTRTTQWTPHINPASQLFPSTSLFEHPYIDSSPVVVNDKVVVGSWISGKYGTETDPSQPTTSVGDIRTFNGQTGELIWQNGGEPLMGGVASTPCIYDGKVYVGSANGRLYCFDLSTGNQLWQRLTDDRSNPPQPSKIIASPVVHNGIVYIGNEAAKIYAFNAVSGDLIWNSPVILPIEQHGVTSEDTKRMTGVSSAAFAALGLQEYLLVGCDDGWLYRLQLGGTNPDVVGIHMTSISGALDGACVESSPTVVGGEVFVGVSRYDINQFYRVNIEPFLIVERAYQLGAECRATAAHWLDHLYVGVDSGHYFHKLEMQQLRDAVPYFALMLDPDKPGPWFVGSAAVLPPSLVYVGNDNGNLYVLYATDLKYITSRAVGSGKMCSSPAIAYNVDESHNRWVYVTTRADGGKLLAFKSVRCR